MPIKLEYRQVLKLQTYIKYSLESHISTAVTFWARWKNSEKVLLASSCLSVRPFAWNKSALTGRTFMAFDVWGFFENSSRKVNGR